MILTSTYIVNIMVLSDLRQILFFGDRPSLKSY